MTARAIRLTIYDPSGVVVETECESVTAEDATGRFGIRPNTLPTVAALVAGVLVARRHRADELVVAVAEGVLHSRPGQVEVAVRQAVVCESLQRVAQTVDEVSRRTASGEAVMRATLRGMLDKVAITVARGERVR